jgi:imidazolonepropionase-like amidohydrolase
MHLLVRLAGLATLGAGLAAPITAQHPPVAPATWAITDARIEPVSGPAIARGTVVIRDGLIRAVGANVAIPADARVIDGSGLTVYPGFIDAYGSLGMPSATAGPGSGAGGQQAARRPSAPNSRYGVGLQPEVDATAELTVPDNGFGNARAAGFTAALTAPSTGVWRGRSALIQLREGNPPDLVIAADVAQHVGFSRGGGGGGGGAGGYPGSLLGVIAQIRQQLLDAQHWRDLSAAYQRNPRGTDRPNHDPSLAALQPAIAGRQPVVFQANTSREILRALGLAREFGLKPIIAGGHEASKVTDALRAANASVLVDFDFPRRTAPQGGRAPSEDDPPESMNVLRSRVERPQVAGKLASAGVPFAVYSGTDYTDFLTNLRSAVENGLARDRAIRALTLDAATVLGAADKLGSIEVGKVANLTIVRGDLFEENGRVAQVFVGGHRYEMAAPNAESGRGR